MTRAAARAQVLRMLDHVVENEVLLSYLRRTAVDEVARIRARADEACVRLQAEEEARCQRDPGDENDCRIKFEPVPPRTSYHTMQQQPARHESHNAYYARRAEQARQQADAHPGEVYDDDLDCWRRMTAEEIEAAHVPQMVRQFYDEDEVLEALRGPWGRT